MSPLARTMASALFSAASLLTGCIPSNVVAPTDRAVRVDAANVVWSAGDAADLSGYWSSRELTGPIASAVRRLHYWFEPDGSFTGAALLEGPPLAFAVLSGTFRFDEQRRLLLGEDAEPALLEKGGGLLRLTGADGIVVLEQEELP
jgi:hypothetical protein